jgi:hypothetical protein
MDGTKHQVEDLSAFSHTSIIKRHTRFYITVKLITVRFRNKALVVYRIALHETQGTKGRTAFMTGISKA